MPLSFRGSTASNLIILTYLIIVFAEMLYLEHIFSEKFIYPYKRNELHLNKILRYRTELKTPFIPVNSP